MTGLVCNAGCSPPAPPAHPGLVVSYSRKARGPAHVPPSPVLLAGTTLAAPASITACCATPRGFAQPRGRLGGRHQIPRFVRPHRGGNTMNTHDRNHLA